MFVVFYDFHESFCPAVSIKMSYPSLGSAVMPACAFSHVALVRPRPSSVNDII
jgi:hypothetical protein